MFGLVNLTRFGRAYGFWCSDYFALFQLCKIMQLSDFKLLYTTFVQSSQQEGAATSFQLTAWLRTQAICWEAIRQHRWVHYQEWIVLDRITRSTGPFDNIVGWYWAVAVDSTGQWVVLGALDH